jgi:gamma-glutamyltranspeptidase/glutathione hydrolase
MISRQFAREQVVSIRDRIDPGLPLKDPPDGGSDTTHLSVMDKEGNAVGITQSIELVYGSKVAAEGLGFLYNNYMNAFELEDPSHPYYLRPNAIPWTSVAPSVLCDKEVPWLVCGSPGSERIYSTISQFLVNMADRDMPMNVALTHPRLHCSIGGTVSCEAERFAPEVLEHLEKMGYRVDRREPYDFYFGAIHAVMKCRTTGQFHGAAEIRRDGIAAGV